MRVENEVLTVLSRAATQGNALTLVGQLDRRLYDRTNKVLEAAGGKWNRKAKAHLFDGDAADAIEQIILTGEITIPQDFGYFPTPEPIVARLIELAEIEPGMTVLEPSAGQGNIAKAVADIAKVDCVELLQKNVEALLAGEFARDVIMSDFLALVPAPTYDRVVMNPPFARQDDIRHVTHAMRFLKEGGRLVSVMAASILFRDNRLTADFRALIDERGGDIEECPEGAFRSSGTMVRTVIVTIPN
jgi:predicted RNA methylase